MAHKWPPVCFAFVPLTSFGTISCPDAANPFFSWVLCALGWACCVRCLSFLAFCFQLLAWTSVGQCISLVRRRCLTSIPGLNLVQRSDHFPCKTVQYQLEKLLRLHKHTFNFKIVFWHVTNNNSITPHSSNFCKHLSSQEPVEEIRALSFPVSATVYCHRINSSPVFDRLKWSFLTVHAVWHLLSHRKLKKNNTLLRKKQWTPSGHLVGNQAAFLDIQTH